MPDTYKSLHNDWKAAKKSAKLVYSFWDRLFTDMSSAHTDVDYSAPPFPKFNLDLGPSLKNLEANKNVDKSKFKATKAAKQYAKDIKAFKKTYNKLEAPKGKDGPRIHKAMGEKMDDLKKVIDRIDVMLAQ